MELGKPNDFETIWFEILQNMYHWGVAVLNGRRKNRHGQLLYRLIATYNIDSSGEMFKQVCCFYKVNDTTSKAIYQYLKNNPPPKKLVEKAIKNSEDYINECCKA